MVKITRLLTVSLIPQVFARKNSKLNILGIGYTIYLGSEYESAMLNAAAQAIFEAHQNGLIVVLRIYPRGTAVGNEKDPHLIAGAAGVAAALQHAGNPLRNRHSRRCRSSFPSQGF